MKGVTQNSNTQRHTTDTAAQFDMPVRDSVTRCQVNAVAYRHSSERTHKSFF